MNKKNLIILIIILILLVFLILLFNNNIEFFTNKIERFTKINHPLYGEIYVFDDNEYISRKVLNNEIWEENVSSLMAEHYIEGTDMLDIGANIGLNTIRMNQIKPITGICHLFEPQADVFLLLEYNTRNLKRELYNFALSDKCDTLSFNQDPDNIGATQMIKDSSGVNVTSTTLDSLRFNNNISLVKMDCEGFEEYVLKGGVNFFSKYKPTLIIEIWKKNIQNITLQLNKMNYNLLSHIGGDDYIYKYNTSR